MSFPNLCGERLDLVDLSESYLGDLDEYSREPSFFAHLEYPAFSKREQSESYFRKLTERSDGRTGHYWMIRLREGGKVIGTFGVLGIDRRTGSAEIGYGLSPRYWGRGLFGEALDLVLRHLFVDQGLHRIWAKTQATNTPSITALKRAGFSEEGRLRDYYLRTSDGCRHDAVLLSLLAPEFRHRNTRL